MPAPEAKAHMSVWESAEDLKNFVYRTAHVELIRDREAWFSRLSERNPFPRQSTTPERLQVRELTEQRVRR